MAYVTVKRISDDLGIEFKLHKYSKAIFKINKRHWITYQSLIGLNLKAV